MTPEINLCVLGDSTKLLNNEAGVTCGVAAVTEVFHGISSLLHSGAVGKAPFIFVCFVCGFYGPKCVALGIRNLQ